MSSISEAKAICMTQRRPSKMINCHTHLFVGKNVPDDFAPLKLVWLVRHPFFAKKMMRFLKLIDPVVPQDYAELFARFIRHMSYDSPSDVLNHMKRHYPKGTKYVVLPMDFEYCGRSKPHQSVDAQLMELRRLTLTHEEIIPFVCVDPRRPNVTNWTKHWINDFNFKGIKLYPSLGFLPQDKRLDGVYEFAEENNVPVVTHCGGTSVQGYNMELPVRTYLNPRNYIEVLHKFPKLRLDIAHFGGVDEWNKSLQIGGNWTRTWVDEIKDIVLRYENVYTDISYTIFSNPLVIDYLKVLLNDEELSQKILFGTDFYMIDLEHYSEKEVCISLEAHLGEAEWIQISETNPSKFLKI